MLRKQQQKLHSNWDRASGSSESLVRPMETVLNLIMDIFTFITK